MSSYAYDALGWVFFHEGRLSEAEKELLHAYELSPQNRDALYDLGRLFIAKGDLGRAEEFYVKGLEVQRPGANPCEKGLEELYAKRNGSLDGYTEYRANIAEVDRARRKERILAERIQKLEVVPGFRLKNLKGDELSLESLKEKTVVINFWGIWCGPCVAEMPDFQKLHEKYSSDGSVAILTVNNDRTPHEVEPWMKKHNYTFPTLLDDGFVSAAGVRAFPTTWFLDPQGNKVFEKVGWSEKLVEEFSWRIDAIKEASQGSP